MLTCVKDQAVKLYDIANKAFAVNGDKWYQGYMKAMQDLFGSKCLPDKTCNVASNVASKEPNPAEEEDVFNVPEPKCKHYKDGKCARPSVCHLENGKLVKGADCDVSSCEDVEYEPKPAEAKFKRGDIVIYKRTGKKKVVFDIDKYGSIWLHCLTCNLRCMLTNPTSNPMPSRKRMSIYRKISQIAINV